MQAAARHADLAAAAGAAAHRVRPWRIHHHGRQVRRCVFEDGWCGGVWAPAAKEALRLRHGIRPGARPICKVTVRQGHARTGIDRPRPRCRPRRGRPGCVHPSCTTDDDPSRVPHFAHRRLKRALRERFAVAGQAGDRDLVVVISGLTGTYSSYITTWEEYQVGGKGKTEAGVSAWGWPTGPG